MVKFQNLRNLLEPLLELLDLQKPVIRDEIHQSYETKYATFLK